MPTKRSGPSGRRVSRCWPLGESARTHLPADAAKPAVRADRRLFFVDLRREDARYAGPLVAEELITADVQAGVSGLDLLMGGGGGAGAVQPTASSSTAAIP